LSQYAALAPAGDTVAADYRALLANNMAHWAAVTDGLGGSGLGYFYEYDIDLYAPGTIAPWQQHFLMQSLGLGSPASRLSASLRPALRRASALTPAPRRPLSGNCRRRSTCRIRVRW
jgi:hypothetical protein